MNVKCVVIIFTFLNSGNDNREFHSISYNIIDFSVNRSIKEYKVSVILVSVCVLSFWPEGYYVHRDYGRLLAQRVREERDREYTVATEGIG